MLSKTRGRRETTEKVPLSPTDVFRPTRSERCYSKINCRKNGGTATSKQNILGVTKSVTVQIGDITKTYSVGDDKNQVRIVE